VCLGGKSIARIVDGYSCDAAAINLATSNVQFRHLVNRDRTQSRRCLVLSNARDRCATRAHLREKDPQAQAASYPDGRPNSAEYFRASFRKFHAARPLNRPESAWRGRREQTRIGCDPLSMPRVIGKRTAREESAIDRVLRALDRLFRLSELRAI